MLALVLQHHADSALPQLLRIPPLSGHGSNLSRVGASRNPGAIHLTQETVWVATGGLHWWMWASILAGWVLTTVVLAVLTGLLKRD